MTYFNYGTKELNYLKSRDITLAQVIDNIGFIKRNLDSSIFESIIKNILSQQISNKAYNRLYSKLIDKYHNLEYENLQYLSLAQLELLIPKHKANYIFELINNIKTKSFDLSKLTYMSDNEAISYLTKLKGVGPWTAQMVLIFAMQRTDIISYSDFAIRKGIKLIYKLDNLDKKSFLAITSKYSPYATIASFYIWAVANNTKALS